MKKTNTMQLKQLNIELIRKELQHKKSGTKASIAKGTQLSIATCGNLLKVLIARGEVIEVDLKPSNGGRPARHFVYNENYAFVACLYPRKEGAYTNITCIVANMLGDIVFETYMEHEDVSLNELDMAIQQLLHHYKDIKVLSIGVPGVVENGVVGICDFPKLSNQSIGSYFQNKYDLTTIMENDVNATALGYYRSNGFEDTQAIAYLYYPVAGNAGSGLMVNGKILSGQTRFAGEIAFMPLGIPFEDQGSLQKDLPKFIDFVSKTISCICCVINPTSVVLSGYCFNDQLIHAIEKKLVDYLPLPHLPEISFEEDIRDHYVAGLISAGLEQLSCHLAIVEKF